MVRDWKIIENILRHFEAGDLQDYLKAAGYLTELGVDEDVYCGHIELVIDSGLVRNAVIDRDSAGHFCSYTFFGVFLTMEGHDFLDALRNKKLWTRIKAKAVSSGMSLSWEFIKAAIPVVIKEALR